jgi:NTE family protein
MKIENLVCEGGGVLGIAYAGAILAMEEHGILDQIQQVAGTSAGAMTAMLLSLRYNAAEIKELSDAANFKAFEDKWNPFRIPLKYGIYRGDKLFKWIRSALVKKGKHVNATFRDFEAMGCRNLRVFACDLNIKNVKEFSLRKTPDVVVAEAVRASMSIPLFFSAWKFRNDNPDNHIYVDGGTVFNYPITTYDEKSFNHKTVGLHLNDRNNAVPDTQLKYGEIFKYIRVLFDTFLSTQSIEYKKDKDNISRSIQIDNKGISATKFSLTKEDKMSLFDSGYKTTSEFLKARKIG